MGYLTMSDKERKQAKVFEQVQKGLITQVEAAARLRITDRWVRSKIRRYYDQGDAGLIHKSRGKESLRRWDKGSESLLIELLQDEWHDFGPTFATEKLKEIHGIKVSREVVRKAMVRASLWQPKRRNGKYRKRRERKPMFGVMFQADGSPHDWFEGRAPWCTLLVFIDDATSKIVWLEFAEAEATLPVMRATKSLIRMYGVPQSFYTDHGSVFYVSLNNEEGIKKTQWERACREVGIEIYHAKSPQAKGRVERCNQTMQDRLIKELRLAGISSIEAANEYLRMSNFIEKHNAKFAVKPTQTGSACSNWELFDLDDIFSIKETRILTNDFSFSYQKRIFQLSKQQRTIIRPKNEIIVKTDLNGKISLWIRKVELAFEEILVKSVQKVTEKKIFDPKPHKRSENSRRWVGGLPPLRESRVKLASPATKAV